MWTVTREMRLGGRVGMEWYPLSCHFGSRERGHLLKLDATPSSSEGGEWAWWYPLANWGKARGYSGQCRPGHLSSGVDSLWPAAASFLWLWRQSDSRWTDRDGRCKGSPELGRIRSRWSRRDNCAWLISETFRSAADQSAKGCRHVLRGWLGSYVDHLDCASSRWTSQSTNYGRIWDGKAVL